MIGTSRFSYGGTDFGKLVKVALWSGLSAFAAVLLDQLQVVDWSAVLGDKAPLAVTLLNVVGFAVAQFLGDTRK